MASPDLNLHIILEVLLAEESVARAAQRLRLSPSAMSRAPAEPLCPAMPCDGLVVLIVQTLQRSRLCDEESDQTGSPFGPFAQPLQNGGRRCGALTDGGA